MSASEYINCGEWAYVQAKNNQHHAEFYDFQSRSAIQNNVLDLNGSCNITLLYPRWNHAAKLKIYENG